MDDKPLSKVTCKDFYLKLQGKNYLEISIPKRASNKEEEYWKQKWKSLWKLHFLPPKIISFKWQNLHQKLFLGPNLPENDQTCSVCRNFIDYKHLFDSCNLTLDILDTFQIFWKSWSSSKFKLKWWIEEEVLESSYKFKSQWILASSLLKFSIWRNFNKIKLGNKKPQTKQQIINWWLLDLKSQLRDLLYLFKNNKIELEKWSLNSFWLKKDLENWSLNNLVF